jgi:hypothetical protein
MAYADAESYILIMTKTNSDQSKALSLDVADFEKTFTDFF